MGTTNTTTSSNQYNPTSMNQYQSFQPQLGGALNSYVSNPLGAVSSIYNLSGQMAQNNAGLLGQTQMGNLTNNLAASGFSGVNLPAYMQSQIAAQGRATSGAQANAFLQNQLGKNQAALGVQQFGIGQMANYRPLQTGNTNVQQQSGLGTWLPQIAGMGLSAAMGGFGGMFSSGTPLYSQGGPSAFGIQPYNTMGEYQPTSAPLSNSLINP